MEQLISRQAAIDAVEFGITYAKRINKETGEVTALFEEGNAELEKAIDRIKQLPPAQPAQPKRGKWEMGKDERFVKCSECGLMTTRNELRGLAVFGKNEPNFCPNCGADMREVTDGNHN